MKSRKTLLNISLGIALILSTIGCERFNDKPESSEDINWFVDTLMHTWYFWNDQVPDVDYSLYSEPQELMNDLMVPKDHWSFIDTRKAVQSYFDEGEEFGFGFYLGWDDTYKLRVILCYKNTTAYSKGVRRGWILNKMNGILATELNDDDFDNFFSDNPGSMEFEFIDAENITTTIVLQKEEYKLNAVFNTSTFNTDKGTTGYFAYQSFLGYSETELDTAVAILFNQGITDLIVDLRYNGGGYNYIAEHFASILAPSGNEGEVFYTLVHNDIVANENDTSLYFSGESLNLNLTRVFFLTNKHTASASELVINGLSPYMEVIQIGDKTAGKPYAMYGFNYGNWLAYPVCAQSINSDGFGEYDNGLVPDRSETDNFAYNWGDENDPLIKQALTYINTGGFGTISLALKGGQKPKVIQGDNIFKNKLLIINK